MRATAVLVGNSSSAIREGAFIGTPAVNIGTRQDGPGARRERRSTSATTTCRSRTRSARQIEHGRYAHGADLRRRPRGRADRRRALDGDDLDPQAHHVLRWTVLGLIPARGGSKGIPRKNLAPLGGQAAARVDGRRGAGRARAHRAWSSRPTTTRSRLRRRSTSRCRCAGRPSSGGRHADARRRPRRARTTRDAESSCSSSRRRRSAAPSTSTLRSCCSRRRRGLGGERRRGSARVHAGLGAATGGRPVAAVRGWAACDPPSGQADALRAQRAGGTGRPCPTSSRTARCTETTAGPIRCRSWNRSTSTTQTTSRSSTC